ncbi:DUF2064 domain-containing protein [candidate division KSB3 bacterium]|uniref:DUF2064 domain-containing protein n=1 Tax=candidate division KSB3 bacterium TaxID=2044937 RepID=A0A9D5JZI3_9BACT|nr:DUF2064 domain-containing protein [candidate division KSB3 bacterium]MBD3327137.1 DUF2064 domain-containing protein [candidate division KSB3 bacterium]
MTRQACLLFYLKFPERGKVKTRLARDIGDEHAVELYCCFIRDMLETLAQIPQQICLCYAPQTAEPRFRRWLEGDFVYLPQHGNNLGERMGNSFQGAFRLGFERVVLIGSDLPDLPAQYVEMAFERLESYKSVIGPSGDGGYYLLGFRRETFVPEVFQDIGWSQSSVYEETLTKLTRHGTDFLALPVWHDIDNLSELHQWYSRQQVQQGGTSRAVRTHAYVHHHLQAYILERC